MIRIEISPGEAYDRLSILEIKRNKIENTAKLYIINQQYHQLKKEISDFINNEIDYFGTIAEAFAPIYQKLKTANEIIWDIEDVVRDLEFRRDFGSEFIKAARIVYHTNDDRHRAKVQIDKLFRSELTEQKEHAHYEKDSTVGKPV